MKHSGIIIVLFFLASCAVSQVPPPKAKTAPKYSSYKMCKGCHDKIVDQHAESHHEKSFSNPVFQGQYFKELLPLAGNDPALMAEARGCTACHSPIAYILLDGHITDARQVDPDLAGVTCDFCHTISGIQGELPGGGNFISQPGDIKFGPFVKESDWHHVYSELQTKSEFCGICHNGKNHRGIEVKSTYSEWLGSRFAKDGIECQDCHMSISGHLEDGKAKYESGTSARMTLTEVPKRKRLYTHRFPGAHSKAQVAASMTVSLMVHVENIPEREVTVRVLVSNENTGHKMPTGSADLRLLWLEVAAKVGDRTIPLEAVASTEQGAYDVAGKGLFDREILNGDVPDGSRIYRSVFLDSAGRQSLSSYNVAKIAFDNRLNAGEVREETYRVKLPSGVSGKAVFEAHLKYLSYPSSFTGRYGLEKAEVFEIHSAKKSVMFQ